MRAAAIGQWLGRFRRSARPEADGRFRIRPRSIYILPTKQGMLLALVLILMLSGSINYGSNLGYLVTFLLAGIWLTSILHTWRNLLGLMLTPQSTSPVFAGQDAVFELLLENPSGLARYAINITAKTASGHACDLPSQHSSRLSVHLNTHRRGLLRLSRVSIYSCYPLGLFKAWTYADPDLSCLVYPRPAEHAEPPTQTVYAQSDDGDRGQGADDFVGLRNFRYGDSPRHIDWKALARERGLFSKLFGGDRVERITLDWDLLTDTDPEQRLSQLCRFILIAEQRHFPYALKLPGVNLPSGLGEEHKHRCLTSLAKYQI